MNELKEILRQNKVTFEPVIPFTPLKDKLLLLDLGKDNNELTGEILDDPRLFTKYINQKLETNGSRYAIGGYDEYREVYSRSRVFDSTEPGGEPRRLHLGIDIWGKPHTPVIAPMDGIVHSFAFNDRPGDYGGTIILTHRLQDTSFYTLYGHLSLNSLRNRREGERIDKGDLFAEFGIPAENGHWAPHLHFQVMTDLQGWVGDYPGVCRLSERTGYLENCPDPDLILQMVRYATTNA